MTGSLNQTNGEPTENYQNRTKWDQTKPNQTRTTLPPDAFLPLRWGRRGHGCAGVQREYLWHHDVSIIFCPVPFRRGRFSQHCQSDSCRYPPATNEVAGSIPAAPATSTPIATPAKRRRHESHGDGAIVVVDSYGIPPQERFRGDKPNRILEGARSALGPTASLSPGVFEQPHAGVNPYWDVN